ncbi:hypothetical protein [Gordonia sp. NPDC003429]
MSNPTQNTPSAADRERAVEAVRLRTAGLQWDEIAQRLGYADPSGPRKAADKLLSRQESEAASTYREVQRRRLEMVMRGHLVAAVGGDVAAAGVVLKVHDRLARLFGLDAPSRVEVGQQMSDEAWATQVVDVLRELTPLGLAEALATLPGGAHAVSAVAGLSAPAEGNHPDPALHAVSGPLSAETDEGEPWADI